MNGVAVVGAGRIGVPWAAVLASELGYDVTCIDVDKTRVETLNRGEAPFDEPSLAEYLADAVAAGTLRATTDPAAVATHRYVAVTLNVLPNRLSEFLDVVREYATHLGDDHVVVVRSTLPVHGIERTRATVNDHADGSPTFTVFPERLAEGQAVAEIETLPKIVGVDDAAGRTAMTTLLDGLDCPVRTTDPETAMFVKLIDNASRDALFAVANQIAYTADQLGLDAHEAIALANDEYPRNDIPVPGPVGGKCLPKDPHFLMDGQVCDQPTTPDLFSATRRTNAALSAYVVTRVLRRGPDRVAVLGLAYKPGVGDTHNSPAADVVADLRNFGVEVSTYDPHVEGHGDLPGTLSSADVVVLAVDHAAFDGVEPNINEHVPEDAVVYDLWGALDAGRLAVGYDGFGIVATDPDRRESADASARADGGDDAA